MEHQHLTPVLFRKLLDRDRGEGETLALLHLLSICPACRAIGGHLVALYQAGAIGLNFCAIDVELAHSRAVAPALFAELAPLSFAEQQDLIRHDERFWRLGLCELLCKESEAIAPADAMRAVDLAELAVLAASLLVEGEPFERSWLDQVKAIAWAHLGNARRVLDELRSAATAFREADELWEAGTGSAGDTFGYEAHYLALKASLRREERQFDQALALLDQALEAEGGPALRAAILIAKAKTLGEMGEVPRAIASLREARTAVDLETPPRLRLCLEQNLLVLLAAEGHAGEAEAILPQVRDLAQALGNRLDLLRLRWVEARISEAKGADGAAAAILEEVRTGLLDQGIGFEAALVSLELAAVHLRRGETGEVKRIAREILPVFRAQDIHREALAALAIFIRAAETETLTPALADRIVEYLRRARHQPDLRFLG